MIVSVAEFRKFVSSDLPDGILEMKLIAAEEMIRAYTHNNFQNRAFRCTSSISDGVITTPSVYFAVGDTVEISETLVNDGIYVIGENMKLIPKAADTGKNLITKVQYPADVKIGVINLVKWDIENRDKVGIASETISRHSVTFFNMDGDNSVNGYPKSLLGFLKPYMKARF